MKPVTQAVAYAYLIPRIQEIGREFGYAIAVHGSLARDLDLIAVPWVEDAKPTVEMVEALREALKGIIHIEGNDDPYDETKKNPVERPHGRKGWAIQLRNGLYIDLSVSPVIA